jgi:integrase
MSTETITVQDAPIIPASTVLEVKDGKLKLRIIESPKGKTYRKPIETWIPLNLSKGEQNVYRYMWEALSPAVPSLIPVAFENKSILKLAKYLSRNRSGSRQTAQQYIYLTARYASFNNLAPDELINHCLIEGVIDQKAVAQETQRLDDYVGELKARNLAPKTISDQVKAIKVFYMVNSVSISLPYRLSNQRINKDRAPTPEELQHLIDIADLRDKVIVSMLALGGFRIGTLAKLQYGHVKRDLESNITPVHVHVESEITKGKYCDYDTFIGKEAADFLRSYLDLRRHGSPCGKIPPEVITDTSPLIRAAHGRIPKSVDGKAVYRAVHNLYVKANMLEGIRGRRYILCAHSIRKFFRTQMAALGVPTEYLEYMMGHTLSTYHDIQMKGIEFLRNIYAASGLSIRPKTRLSKIETLKEIIRAWGMNPEEILTREAMLQPHRTIISNNLADTDNGEVQALSAALKDMMRKELLSMKEQE